MSMAMAMAMAMLNPQCPMLNAIGMHWQIVNATSCQNAAAAASACHYHHRRDRDRQDERFFENAALDFFWKIFNAETSWLYLFILTTKWNFDHKVLVQAP
jgi:hypothetical protein